MNYSFVARDFKDSCVHKGDSKNIFNCAFQSRVHLHPNIVRWCFQGEFEVLREECGHRFTYFALLKNIFCCLSKMKRIIYLVEIGQVVLEKKMKM